MAAETRPALRAGGRHGAEGCCVCIQLCQACAVPLNAMSRSCRKSKRMQVAYLAASSPLSNRIQHTHRQSDRQYWTGRQRVECSQLQEMAGPGGAGGDHAAAAQPYAGLQSTPVDEAYRSVSHFADSIAAFFRRRCVGDNSVLCRCMLIVDSEPSSRHRISQTSRG